MWPNYYEPEARRLADQRTRDVELTELAREAALYRETQQTSGRRVLRRGAARLALAAGRASVRLARALDECTVGDGADIHSGATRLG